MHRLYIHPLPVRIWHWTNAVGFVLMILTGMQIRYVGLIDVVSFRTAVSVHNFVGFVLIANFFLWLVFYLTSDRIRAYHSELNPRKHFIGSLRQVYYYGFGIFRGEPNPFQPTIYRKFNPLQSMIYQIIVMLLSAHPDLYRHPVVGREALLRSGRFLRRRAGDRHRACPDLHRLRLLRFGPRLSRHARPHPDGAFQVDDDRLRGRGRGGGRGEALNQRRSGNGCPPAF